MKIKASTFFALALSVLASCQITQSGKTYPGNQVVEFTGLRFRLLSAEPQPAPETANDPLICRVSYENLGTKSLDAIFQPKFAVIDQANREFQAADSLGMNAGKLGMSILTSRMDLLKSLNPGVPREVTLAFELPPALSTGRGLRLRVMCPSSARAGFMMQQYTLRGPFFYFDLSSLPDPDPQASEARNSKPLIRNGMTRQAVYDLWGESSSQSDNGTRSVWIYTIDGDSVFLTFENDKLMGYTPPFVPQVNGDQ